MLDLLLIPIIICLIISLKVRNNTGDRPVFSRTQTASINGFFVLMIFIRHFSEYISVGQLDWVIGRGQRYLDQLIVVSFMFFSGYSLALQQAKNSSYAKKLPRQILSLWLMLIVTVLAFLCVQYFLGNKFDLITILLSMIGYKKVGNSNWYIVAIAVLWLLSFIAYTQKRFNPRAVMGLLMVIYMIVFANMKGVDDVMYNTVIAYYLGIIYFEYEKPVLSRLSRGKIYWPAAVLSVLMMAIGLVFRESFIMFELCVTAACLFLILFSMKLEMNSPVFMYLNRFSLEIYLIQRIPMLIFRDRLQPNILYFIIAAAITWGLALVWKKIYEKVSAF